MEGFEGMSAEVNNKMEWGGREDGLRRRWVSGINMGSNVYGHMGGDSSYSWNELLSIRVVHGFPSLREA